jgi:CheY-like chemotaxis protein
MMTRPTWIILDDDTDVRNVMKGMCMVWDIEPIELRDGREAMALLDRIERGEGPGTPPEAALLDLRLPGPSGAEVSARMRRMPYFNETVIVLLTAFTLQNVEQEAVMHTAQADLFLHKPLPRLMEFNRQIQQMIQVRKQAANNSLQSPVSSFQSKENR